MPKKFIAVLLAFLLTTTPVISHAQPGKLILGLCLIGGGAFMTIDGFSTVKEIEKEWDEDISNPQIDISNWAWTKELIFDWWAEPYGTVKNTGNVPLEWVNIVYCFTDAADNYITGNYTYLDIHYDKLPVGYYDSWWGISNCGSIEPMYGYVTVTYEYDPLLKHHVIYKEKTKNPTEGVLGIGAIGFGTYLVVDYLIDLQKLKKRAGIEIKVTRKQDTTYFLCSKNF